MQIYYILKFNILLVYYILRWLGKWVNNFEILREKLKYLEILREKLKYLEILRD